MISAALFFFWGGGVALQIQGAFIRNVVIPLFSSMTMIAPNTCVIALENMEQNLVNLDNLVSKEASLYEHEKRVLTEDDDDVEVQLKEEEEIESNPE